jgi:hypothetical protein
MQDQYRTAHQHLCCVSLYRESEPSHPPLPCDRKPSSQMLSLLRSRASGRRLNSLLTVTSRDWYAPADPTPPAAWQAAAAPSAGALLHLAAVDIEYEAAQPKVKPPCLQHRNNRFR